MDPANDESELPNTDNVSSEDDEGERPRSPDEDVNEDDTSSNSTFPWPFNTAISEVVVTFNVAPERTSTSELLLSVLGVVLNCSVPSETVVPP